MPSDSIAMIYQNGGEAKISGSKPGPDWSAPPRKRRVLKFRVMPHALPAQWPQPRILLRVSFSWSKRAMTFPQSYEQLPRTRNLKSEPSADYQCGNEQTLALRASAPRRSQSECPMESTSWYACAWDWSRTCKSPANSLIVFRRSIVKRRCDLSPAIRRDW